MPINTYTADSLRGHRAEAYVYSNAVKLTGIEVQMPLEQRAGEEGDFLMMDDSVLEVKADSNGAYLRTGNVCVQISNDSGTSTGWLYDLMQPDKRHVDDVMYLLCADYECRRPYAAITIPVAKLARMCGCHPEGCDACGRCEPHKKGWQREAFPDARLTPNNTCICLPIDDVLTDADVRVMVLCGMDRLTSAQRERYMRLLSAEQ